MKHSLTKNSKYAISTLIKVLILVSIIIVLLVIFLVNYALGGFQLNLRESAYKLAQDIRRVEEMAMLVEEFEGSIPLGGYGVNFDLSNPTSYILFADNGNSIYDFGDIIIEEVNLEGKIRINELYGGEEGIKSASPLNIVFTPPNPIVRINSDKGSGKIILWSEKTNETAAIYVNLAGLIEVQ